MLQGYLFNPTDTVTVRSDLIVHRLYSNIYDYSCVNVTDLMVSYGGDTKFIEGSILLSGHKTAYRLQHYPCYWTDDMFVEGHRIRQYIVQDVRI